MEEMNTNVLKDLIQTRKVLKQKYKDLVSGEVDTANRLEETFKPITKPIKELISQSKIKSSYNDLVDFNHIKKKVKHEHKNEKSTFTSSTPFKSAYNSFYKSIPTATTTQLNTDDGAENLLKDVNDFNENLINDDDDDDDDDEMRATDDNYNIDNNNDNVDNNVSLQNLSQLRDKKELDFVFGPYKTKDNNIWMFGDKSLTFHKNNNNIQIGDYHYDFSPGLFQLLFHKNPSNYNQTDLKYYKKILMDSNAYRRGYKPNGQIKGNRSKKYTDIIKNLIKNDDIDKENSHKQSSTKEGSGILDYIDKKPNYIYWDDPNELVERLRLLIASKSAGHNNHNNEIVSIIEELKEGGFIK